MGEGVTGHVFLPKNLKGRAPAVVYLHPYSHANGFFSHDGFGMESFERIACAGYIVLAYDQFGFGSRTGQGGPVFYEKNPRWSELGKLIADARRAVDVLCALDAVDRERIGAIGFSLGGKVALYAAAFDERVRATVSACGFSSLRTEKREFNAVGIRSYSVLRGLAPRMGFFAGNEERLPYDYDELISLIAPRAVLIIAPKIDRYTDLTQVKSCVKRASQVYKLLGAGGGLELQTPCDYHRFAPPRQKEAIEWLDRMLKGGAK